MLADPSPLIVRIHSCTMIRQIDDLINFRDCSFYDRFNALFKCEVGGSASLASAMESQVNPAISNIHHLNRPTMLGDSGIDLCIDQVLDLLSRIPSDKH